MTFADVFNLVGGVVLTVGILGYVGWIVFSMVRERVDEMRGR